MEGRLLLTVTIVLSLLGILLLFKIHLLHHRGHLFKGNKAELGFNFLLKRLKDRVEEEVNPNVDETLTSSFLPLQAAITAQAQPSSLRSSSMAAFPEHSFSEALSEFLSAPNHTIENVWFYTESELNDCNTWTRSCIRQELKVSFCRQHPSLQP